MKAPEGTVWIGSGHPFDLHEAYLNFRADLDLAARPATAVLHLSADSRYRLWVNGSFVGRGPERSWPSAMAVDARDVTALLQPGVNRIAVQVYSPGYSHFAHVHRAACGMIGWLTADGRTVLRTNAEWRVQRDRSWAAEVPRVSIYGTGVEMRDMRQAVDWQVAEVADWAYARIVQPPEGPIWARLRPRATALPVEERLALAEPWQIRTGPTQKPAAVPPVSAGDLHDDLRAALALSHPGSSPDRLAPGQSAIWIYDLGVSRAVVGGASVSASGGERLTISYAEKLRGGEVLLPDPATYCRMRPTDCFVLRRGRQELEGFTLRGGRYLVFRLEAGAKAIPVPKFHVRVLRVGLEERPLPALPRPLDAVAAMCRRTTLACLQDGFVDSVWRESSLWLGDVVAQEFALRAISDDARPLLFALAMAAEGAAADGLLPSVLPGDVPAYVVMDYNFSWVELLAACITHPGVADPDAILRRHWPTLVRMLARFAADRRACGLICGPPGRRLFLDWSAMSRDEPNLTYNLRYLHALQLASGLATRLGMGEAAGWQAEAAALRAAIRTGFAEAQGWRESPGGAAASQLALAFVILTRMQQGAEAQALADRIVARSMDGDDAAPEGKLVLASPFMHHYVFQALDLLGRDADIRAIIALRWGRWAAAGEPTTWENWSIDFPDGSACHGFSAHPLGWLAR